MLDYLHMDRRNFITFLGGAVATWPVAARSQQVVPVVGFLNGGSPDLFANPVRAFQQGLADSGYVGGSNVTIEYRWGETRYDRLPALAHELVQRRANVVVAGGIPAALAAKTLGTKVPIIFYVGGDPVELGLVSSLSRPNSNLTGVTNLNIELGPKRVELLHELVPAATTMALLVNPANPNAEDQWRDISAAARTLNLQPHLLRASSERDFDEVFAALAKLQAGGLVIGADGVFVNQSEKLAALAVRHAVPAIFQLREFVVAGGLASYGGSFTDAYHQVGLYTGRVLKGENPSDLPVVQTTKAELILNLKTARALGLKIPLSLLGRADEVIE